MLTRTLPSVAASRAVPRRTVGRACRRLMLACGLACLGPAAVAAAPATAAVAPAPVPAAPAPAAPAPVVPAAEMPASAASPSLAADCPPPLVVPPPAAFQDGLRTATDNGLLWRVRKDGHDSWLYGTLHVARFDWMFPGPNVFGALQAADRVAFELDAGDPDILARLQRAVAVDPAAPPLPAALEARLARDARAACVAPETLVGMRPEMRGVTVTMGGGRRHGLEAAYGVDMFLMGLAHGLRKDVRSLERPEDQAALLVSDDPAETVHTLERALDEVERGDADRQLLRLAGDWHDGNLDDLTHFADWCRCLDTAEDRANFKRLADDRNPGMARQLVAWHAEGKSVFLAVGTLHMIGPSGLPALLAKEGFEVVRVR